ncbi:MAG: NAD(P)-binding domain-containing protein [Calditrichia bacterium]|nr:NAD(P)-binding domain-containing protein [Calditrichia bacterium]
MESVLIWFVTLALIIIIILPYFLKFRRQQKQNEERKREAVELGIDRPRAQYPFIDQSSCIGCGSCVLACPEGDVLGVIFGKATVINGMRCVGHGNCEPACPVGGIEVGLGDIKTREDIPHVDDYYESNVPGIFIVGELGGISLIRNAIEHGTKAITKIVGKPERSTDPNVKDVLIVGAGPAGLTAALKAIQHNLNYLVLDQQEPGGTILQYPRQKLVMTQPVEIPLYGKLKKSEYSKEHLLEMWQQLINKYSIQIRTDTKVEAVIRHNGEFHVVSSNGEFRSKYVVLAMGRRGTPRKLGVPGEELSKVTYQLIDAQSFQHQNILVVGGGDSAIEAAVGLARQKGNKVTISYRKPKFFRIKKKNEDNLNELLKQKRIEAIFESNVLAIDEKSVQLQIKEQILEIPNDYVFVFAGGIPPFQMLQDMGISFGGKKEVSNQQN